MVQTDEQYSGANVYTGEHEGHTDEGLVEVRSGQVGKVCCEMCTDHLNT